MFQRRVFSRFSWSLDFGAKMAEFPLPVLQIWRSRKRVAIQIQLMNIHVSECEYYCLHLVPKFGNMCDRQNWRLHLTDKLLHHFEIWQAQRQQCCRGCCQISDRLDFSTYKSHGFETSRDLTLRRVYTWNSRFSRSATVVSGFKTRRGAMLKPVAMLSQWGNGKNMVCLRSYCSRLHCRSI